MSGAIQVADGTALGNNWIYDKYALLLLGLNTIRYHGYDHNSSFYTRVSHLQ